MISIIILFILVGLFALGQAQYDSKLMPSFKPKALYQNKVNHKLAWIYRAFFVFGMSLLFLKGINFWLLLSLGAWFSMVFRFSLNKLRNASWDYISISNWYDSFFSWISTKHGGKIVYGVEILVFILGLIKFL